MNEHFSQTTNTFFTPQEPTTFGFFVAQVFVAALMLSGSFPGSDVFFVSVLSCFPSV